MPGDDVFASIRKRLAEAPGTVLLWESAPLPEIAERMQSELGLRSLTVSPCETPPESGDYLDVTRANLAELETAF